MKKALYVLALLIIAIFVMGQEMGCQDISSVIYEINEDLETDVDLSVVIDHTDPETPLSNQDFDLYLTITNDGDDTVYCADISYWVLDQDQNTVYEGELETGASCSELATGDTVNFLIEDVNVVSSVTFSLFHPDDEVGSNDVATLVITAANDADNDGLDDSVDLCPSHYDPNNVDVDGDGLGDVCDPCFANQNVCFGDLIYTVTVCDDQNSPTYSTSPTDDCSTTGYCMDGACLTSSQLTTSELNLKVEDIKFLRFEDEAAVFGVTVKNYGNQELSKNIEGELTLEYDAAYDIYGTAAPAYDTVGLSNPLTTTFAMRAGTLEDNDEREYTVKVADPFCPGCMEDQRDNLAGVGVTHRYATTVDLDTTMAYTPLTFQGLSSVYASTDWPDCFDAHGNAGDTLVGSRVATSDTLAEYSSHIGVYSDFCEPISDVLKEVYCADSNMDSTYEVVQAEVNNCGCDGTLHTCTYASADLTAPSIPKAVEFDSMLGGELARFTVTVFNDAAVTVSTPFDVSAKFYNSRTKQLLGECTKEIITVGPQLTSDFECDINVRTLIPTIIEEGNVGIITVVYYDYNFEVFESDEKNIHNMGVSITTDDLLAVTSGNPKQWLVNYS
jgi:hypothetical protein